MRPWLTAACVALLAPLLFWGAASLPFLDLESYNVLFTHEAFASWESLLNLASPGYFADFGEGGYRPLTTLVYFLVHAASGADPLAFKLVKTALHGLNAGLVYAIGLHLLRSRSWALLASLHYLLALAFPAFQGIAFLPDILAGSFCLGATASHLGAFAGGRPGPPMLTTAFYACALLSKEMSAFLPLTLLLHDLLLLPKTERTATTLARRHLPLWLALGLFLAVLTWGVSAGTFYGPLRWSWPQDAWLPVSLLAGYASAYFAPSDTLSGWALALILLACGVEAGLRIRRRTVREPMPWSGLAFLLLWTLLALLPILNALPFPKFLSYFQSPDMRFLAFGGAGLGLAAAMLGASRSLGPVAKAMLALTLLSGMTFQFWSIQASLKPWRAGLPAAADAEFESVALQRSAIAKRQTPLLESTFAKLLLSLPSLNKNAPGLNNAVVQALTTRLPADDSRALLDLFGRSDLLDDPASARHALWLLTSGNLDTLLARRRAELAYQGSLGLLEAGLPAKALPGLELAWALDPTHYPACYSLAETLLRLKQDAKAWRQASACDGLWQATLDKGLAETSRRLPDQTLASKALLVEADTLAAGLRYTEALHAYRRAAEAVPFTWPEHWAALREAGFLASGARQAHNEAMAAFQSGDPVAALRGFKKAVTLDPRFGPAHASSAALKARQGDRKGSLWDCELALAQPLSNELKALVYSTRASLTQKNSAASRQSTKP
ncbi:MAG: hypothetical protein WC943_05250 [Elusimicrobiota bacterium]|jgi:tetratricopeptide (TPR) repeat protein